MDVSLYGLRVLSHGQITDLTKGFDLGGIPFSVFIRPKGTSMEMNVLLDCRLICDEKAGAFPVPVGDWTPGAIVRISPNAINLDDYDLYWGAGETIKK